MPAISKIRFTNVIYEGGEKRYNDEIFQFDGHNGAILLENGGGKTVFIQTAIQAVLPHSDLGERKIKDTLLLDGDSAHIAIEWILNENPRRYGLTAVTLFINKRGLDSYKYVYEYEAGDKHCIEELPFVKKNISGKNRPSSKEEINEYYQYMKSQNIRAKTFDTIKSYQKYIEDYFKIIPSEWRKIALINGAEGGVEEFFNGCKTTSQLVDNLLIPAVEEGLAGNAEKNFVDTFEKQRERFKKHRQLKERIEESKMVENEIKFYVEVFTDLYNKNQEFIAEKEKAKSVYKFTKEEQDNINDQLEDNKKQQQDLIDRKKELNRKKESYKLAILEKEVDEYKKMLEDSKTNYNLVNDRYQLKNKRLKSLEIADLKNKIKEKEDKISIYEEQLKLLDSDEAVFEIEEKLNKNTSQLKGYFIEEEEKLNNQKSFISSQIRRYTDDTKDKKDELNKLEYNKLEAANEKIRIETTIKNIEDDMQKISNKILDNPINEKVEEQLSNWKKRIIDIEKNKELYRKCIYKIKEEKIILNKELPILSKKFKELSKKESDITNNINIVLQNEKDILIKLKEFNANWDFINSLYLKQPTILQYTENKIEKLRKEKEELLLNERLSHRFFDDYNDNEQFTADPVIQKWINSWKNQFGFVETGVTYVQRAAKSLGKAEEYFYNKYKYWPIVLVTLENEVEKLMNKINQRLDKLMHPVFIITDKEAKDLLNNNTVKKERYVFPMYWGTNLNQDYFIKWKNEIKLIAKRSTEKRQEKEVEYNRCSEILKHTRTFFEKYPYEYYQKLQDQKKKIKDEIQILEKEIKIKEDTLIKTDNELSNNQVKLSSIEQETLIVSNKIEQATEYIAKNNNKESKISKKYKVIEKINQLDYEIKKINNEIEILEKTLEDIKIDFRDIDYKINHLKSDDLYMEVSKAKPIYTSTSKKVLEEYRKELKDNLNNKQKGRRELENSINIYGEYKDSLNKDLENKLKKVEFDIEDIEFPLHGDKEIDNLIDETNNIKNKLDSLTINFNKAKENYNDKYKEYSIREEDFYDEFDEKILFNISMKQVNDNIEKEKNEIINQDEYLTLREKKLCKEKKDIEQVIFELKSKNERYEFLLEEVKEIVISEEYKQEFPYNKKMFIEKIINKLDELQKGVNVFKDRVQSKQDTFVKFCDDNICDVKLKKMVVSGIKYKKDYDDVLKWQNKMSNRISRTIKIAEEDMREHDKELQQYINHLHTHLCQVAQEIKIIPNKTRVKVDNSWKAIFTFSIPEWNEQEGKEELRKHIDWMIKQLESHQFKDEAGNENDILVKKSIEKWLQTKQLLQNVMKQNNIKIKCRKVTNNGKVDSVPTSWEKSNNWSGGEKWSKNMTLFLGILNYLSEKRHHILKSQKSNRIVIVDNPFGKASSDHVLDPVFFVAQQLGFQIIALTAHAEGKFIRDYFPIVYSCKLRASTNGDNLILTKEKEIRYTFFKDNDPQALMRLGDQEQLALF
ncbi:hypothetical protein [Tepidibacter sp. Z1-5]|uniref:hypothetical protein n=1 Tax=Tepidibacter sp. Z1-5 TaxID=3134138 RepID=UPI0030BABEAA